jgi:D-serine deaminase-like pyridoxal phosphate-dependent protein
MKPAELPTPALVVDLPTLEENVATMARRWPGESLRPHVKAFKSTALAKLLDRVGHHGFCAATLREVEGMADAGLGADILLANETLDTDRLAALARRDDLRLTIAVDSIETIEAAAAGGVGEVLIDVCVGLPRCGCEPADAGRLADLARDRGLAVRGVMGYEGHIVGLEDRSDRRNGTDASMADLAAAHQLVGGAVVSGGGTGTWDLNSSVTELQAGSYTLMDTAYAALDLPFTQALTVAGTVLSVNRSRGFAVADVGLKALGMDHGLPRVEGHDVWFCSDEHVTFAPRDETPWPSVGQAISVLPAHVDPTVAYHERMHVVRDDEVVDVWPVDLRNW